jgi:hypothetical protein
MLEKVRERGHQDPLFFHKIGFALGSVAGLLTGLIISGSAEKFDLAQLEVEDGSEENTLGEPALEQSDNTE